MGSEKKSNKSADVPGQLKLFAPIKAPRSALLNARMVPMRAGEKLAQRQRANDVAYKVERPIGTDQVKDGDA